MRSAVSLLAAALFAVSAPAAAHAQSAPPAGKVTITPYGSLLTTAFWNDGPFSQKDGGFQVLANHDGGAFELNARGSRMGLKIGLPEDPWTGAALSGQLELDFKAGQLPTTTYNATSCTAASPPVCTVTTTIGAPSNAWYNAVPRLRLAFMSASWGTPERKITLVAGQDWGLIGPLSGSSLGYGMDPLYNRAGNIWRRSPQVKAIAEFGTDLGGSVAVAALAPADANISNASQFGAYTADYGAGNRSRVPNVEARGALWYKQGTTKLFEVGLSAHYDKRRYAYGTTNALSFVTQDTEGKILAADLLVNVPYATVQGEFFFNDGAADSVNGIAPAAVVFGGAAPGTWRVQTVQSHGGWVQLVLKPVKAVQIPIGYGFEQVNYPQGGTATSTGLAPGTNTRNSTFTAGVLFNMTNPWQLGFEVLHTLSGYGFQATAFSRSAEANQYALTSKLNF